MDEDDKREILSRISMLYRADLVGTPFGDEYNQAIEDAYDTVEEYEG